jgi:hypothetical protein
LLDGYDYDDVFANATNIALSTATTTFTNLFLFKAGTRAPASCASPM